MNLEKRNPLTRKVRELEAQVAELQAALQELSRDFFDCDKCEGTGKDDGEVACRYCGGYGFNPGGDIREHINDARLILERLSA